MDGWLALSPLVRVVEKAHIAPIMTGPLTAGDRLARAARFAPPQTAVRLAAEPPRRPRGSFRGCLRGLVGGVLAVVVLGGLAGAIGGFMAWRYYSANLPTWTGCGTTSRRS